MYLNFERVLLLMNINSTFTLNENKSLSMGKGNLETRKFNVYLKFTIYIFYLVLLKRNGTAEDKICLGIA